MSLESFFGLDDAEGQGSAEAAEAFRERMRQGAKAIKNMGAHQKQQKQKEDKLAQLLVRYLRDQTKSDLLFLIIRLLEQNIPGAFILAVLTISDPQLEKELRAELNKIKKIEGPKSENKDELVNYGSIASLPSNVVAELDAWGQLILEAGLMRPQKTLENVLTPDHKLKSIVLDLIAYSLEQFFEHNTLHFSEDKIRKFSLVSIQSVLIKLRDKTKEVSDIELIESPID